MPTLSVTLNRGLVNREDMERKTETNLDADEHLLVREGDIAYNMMRMWQGAFGRATSEGIVSPAYVVLRPLEAADSGYFEYAFRRARSIYLFWAYSYGLTNDRLRLYGDDFLRIPFSAPSLAEQRKIAGLLTAVDGRIQQLSQKKALLQNYKKGVMQQLFTQTLRFKDDHGNDFPDWEEKTLADVCNGQITNGVFNDPTKVGKGYRLINVSDMYRGSFINVDLLPRVDIDSKEFEKNRVKYGDIFFTRSSLVASGIAWSNVNLSYSNDITYDGHLMRISPDLDLFDPVFLSNLMHVASVRKQFIARGKTGTMTTIGQKDIASVSFDIPSLIEQTKIANFLIALDLKIESVAKQIELTQSFKRGLLQQMFV